MSKNFIRFIRKKRQASAALVPLFLYGFCLFSLLAACCSPSHLAYKIAKLPDLPSRNLGYKEVACEVPLTGRLAFAGLATARHITSWRDGNVENALCLTERSPQSVFAALSVLRNSEIGAQASFSPMPEHTTGQFIAETKGKYYIYMNPLPGFITAYDVSRDTLRIDSLCLRCWNESFPADYYLYLHADIYSISVAMGGGLNITPALTVYVIDKKGERVFSKRYFAKYRVKPAPEGDALADTCCALFSNLASDQMKAIIEDMKFINGLTPAGEHRMDQLHP